MRFSDHITQEHDRLRIHARHNPPQLTRLQFSVKRSLILAVVRDDDVYRRAEDVKDGMNGGRELAVRGGEEMVC